MVKVRSAKKMEKKWLKKLEKIDKEHLEKHRENRNKYFLRDGEATLEEFYDFYCPYQTYIKWLELLRIYNFLDDKNQPQPKYLTNGLFRTVDNLVIVCDRHALSWILMGLECGFHKFFNKQ
jgi:hypothetical protein